MGQLDDRSEHIDREFQRKVHRTKQDLYNFRKLVVPLREVFSRLEKEENSLISKTTRPFFRALYEQMIHITESVENFRDNLINVLSTYQTTIGNKMNEIMSALTIISTIFLPLTLVAGIYGMNFHYMPELSWKIGYPFALLIMPSIAVIMLYLIKKRGWFTKF